LTRRTSRRRFGRTAEATKLKAIREALRTAKRVWLATDCDREGQLIGQEILEHYEYRGQVMRVLFTAQDSQTRPTAS
jgi:DNA topoisomerase-3